MATQSTKNHEKICNPFLSLRRNHTESTLLLLRLPDQRANILFAKKFPPIFRDMVHYISVWHPRTIQLILPPEYASRWAAAKIARRPSATASSTVKSFRSPESRTPTIIDALLVGTISECLTAADAEGIALDAISIGIDVEYCRTGFIPSADHGSLH
jgi:hypothetical protein